MLYPLYHSLTSLSAPFLRALIARRLAKGKEITGRTTERFGIASRPRPDNKLIWCHAASVGESLSILPLLDELQTRLPDWRFLITTNTVTSAELMAQRLPTTMIHQFIPFDHPVWVNNFVTHWKPDAAVWMESELWPNLLAAIRKRNVPCALLNARLRPKSYKRWRLIKPLAAQMLGTFNMILCGARSYIPLFQELGGTNVRYVGSLKFGSKPLPVEQAEYITLRDKINNRPCIGFFSTHSDEEQLFLRTTQKLLVDHPDHLILWIPRQPKRGTAISELAKKENIACALRSNHEPITAHTQLYIADTIGEMGLWYKLCKLVVIGGSFIPHGGQNPIEGIHFGCGIVYGPHMFNFPELCGALEEAKAARRLTSADELAPTLHSLLSQTHELAQLQTAARDLAAHHNDVIGTCATELINGLNLS
jgi:3-deoxy-D-manno-octulosonic-acid transferase